MYFISLSFQHSKMLSKGSICSNTNSHLNLYPRYITIYILSLPLYKILYIAAVPKGLLLGITYKNISGGVVGRFAVDRGKTLDAFSLNKILIFVYFGEGCQNIACPLGCVAAGSGWPGAEWSLLLWWLVGENMDMVLAVVRR